MRLTKDERTHIEIIKKDFDTRHKWTKQDYVDFYARDVELLLNVCNRALKSLKKKK